MQQELKTFFRDREDVETAYLFGQCSPLFAHRIVRDGILVKDAAPERRVAREERIIHRYVDTKPLREAQWRIARDRIRREG